MSLYIVVEGRRTEKKVYKAWLDSLLPHLTQVPTPQSAASDTYYIISGNGYPQYLEAIKNSVGDVKDHPAFKRIIVAIDSEELTMKERYDEVLDVIESADCHVPVDIIVQNPCIETWFLGNSSFIRPNPSQSDLNEFLNHYDVRQRDPEALETPESYPTKAGYHLAYFKAACRERGLSYTKKNPGDVTKRTYLEALAKRFDKTNHIPSFGALLSTFRAIGASI